MTGVIIYIPVSFHDKAGRQIIIPCLFVQTTDENNDGDKNASEDMIRPEDNDNDKVTQGQPATKLDLKMSMNERYKVESKS